MAEKVGSRTLRNSTVSLRVNRKKRNILSNAKNAQKLLIFKVNQIQKTDLSETTTQKCKMSASLKCIPGGQSCALHCISFLEFGPIHPVPFSQVLLSSCNPPPQERLQSPNNAHSPQAAKRKEYGLMSKILLHFLFSIVNLSS